MFLEFDGLLHDEPENVLINYLKVAESTREELRYVHNYWFKIIEGVRSGVISKGFVYNYYEGSSQRDKERITAYLSIGSYTDILETLDVMLCVRCYMDVKTRMGGTSFKHEELDGFVSQFYPGTEMFEVGLAMLGLEGDVVKHEEKDEYYLSLINSFKHPQGCFTTGFKALIFGVFAEGNDEGLKEDVLLELIGNNGIKYYKSKMVLHFFRRQGLLKKLKEKHFLLKHEDYTSKCLKKSLNELDYLSALFKFSKQTWESDLKKMLSKTNIVTKPTEKLKPDHLNLRTRKNNLEVFASKILKRVTSDVISVEDFNKCKKEEGVGFVEAEQVLGMFEKAGLVVRKTKDVIRIEEAQINQ